MSDNKLYTKAEYDKLPPYEQGFIQYWQGEQPGSELKRARCHYPKESSERAEWDRGQLQATLAAQDGEE